MNAQRVDDQLSCLPLASPANVLNTLDQLRNRIARLSPDMDARDLLELLGEFALTSLCLDRTEYHCRTRVEQSARRFSLIP